MKSGHFHVRYIVHSLTINAIGKAVDQVQNLTVVIRVAVGSTQLLELECLLLLEGPF